MAQIAILNKYRNELGRAYRKMYDNGTRSEWCKELWRKEQLRAFYGLERKTNLRIPSSPLSHSASAHKHAMIRCCNYFADPLGGPRIICYDSETHRSAQREATAAKHGLKVVEADE